MTRVMTGARLGMCVLAAVVSAAVIRGQQPAPPPFNAAQAAAGRQLYEMNCASCHRADLSGAAEAPALAGPNFTRVWGSRTAAQLAA
jgi:mono/diheme cytochrome c family protein